MAARVVVGGTFDILHRGHRTLLAEAVRQAGTDGHLYVGLTTDELARKGRTRPIGSFAEREETLRAHISRAGIPFTIVALEHPLGEGSPRGGAAAGDYDVLVVSEETAMVSATINELRSQRGLRPLRVVVVEMVRSHDGAPLSSTAIAEGSVDHEGRAYPRRRG